MNSVELHWSGAEVPNDARGKSVCVYNFLHVVQLLLPDPLIFQFPPLVLPSLLLWCREPGLVLDDSAAAPSGTTHRGGPCEGGRPRPRGWLGLTRALARTPLITGGPLRGAKISPIRDGLLACG